MISYTFEPIGIFPLYAGFLRENCTSVVHSISRYIQLLLTNHAPIRRSPDVIKADGGFKTFAQSKGTKPNYSLWDHCKIKEASASFGNLPDDGYVGTSVDVNFCAKWMIEKLEDGNTENIQSTIYKIASDMNLIGCQETLKNRTNMLHTCQNTVLT